MIREKSEKNIFLSHAWGLDNKERDNHTRCKILYEKLIEEGYSVWFDEKDMKGNIDNSIIKGINNAKVIILCLTEKYCDKINTAVNNNLPNDNCYKEWSYSLFKQKIIIPVIMEPDMRKIYTKTDGIIQMYLNNTLYIDLSDEIEENFFNIESTLNYYGINSKYAFNITPNSSNNSLSNYFMNALSPNKKSTKPAPEKNVDGESAISSKKPISPKKPNSPNKSTLIKEEIITNSNLKSKPQENLDIEHIIIPDKMVDESKLIKSKKYKTAKNKKFKEEINLDEKILQQKLTRKNSKNLFIINKIFKFKFNFKIFDRSLVAI